jgi:hypothetical protein
MSLKCSPRPKPKPVSLRLHANCLLKGCEQRFHPRQARQRYCSERCREASRKWSRWKAQQQYRFAPIRLTEIQGVRAIDWIESLPAIFVAHTPRHAALKALVPFASHRLLEPITTIALRSKSWNRGAVLCALLSRLKGESWSRVFDEAWNEILGLPMASVAGAPPPGL